MLKQLITQRSALQVQVENKISELENFLRENNIEEEILVTFRFQGSLQHNPIKPTVGRAKDMRYVSFGWGTVEDKVITEWCLVCLDQNKIYNKKMRLSSADNFYKIAFVERVGVFLERMETWLFNSNDLVEKSLGTLDTFIGDK